MTLRKKIEGKFDLLKNPMLYDDQIPVYNNSEVVAYLNPIQYNFEDLDYNLSELLSRWRVENPSISTGTFKVTEERTSQWLLSHVLGRKDRIIFIDDLNKFEKIEDNFFDIINLSSVIEHVHNPVKLILQLKKKLHKNGLMIIKTPNFNSFSRKIFGRNWHNLDIPRHLHIFSDKNLEKLLIEKNFKKKKIIYSRNSGVEIKSLYNLLKVKKNNSIHKYLINLFNPLTFLLSIFKLSSTITIIVRNNEKI